MSLMWEVRLIVACVFVVVAVCAVFVALLRDGKR